MRMTFNKSRLQRFQSCFKAEPGKLSGFFTRKKPPSHNAGNGHVKSGIALALISAGSLAAASLITACSQFTQTLTVDFVYVVSNAAAGANQYGQIDVFEINSESGRMRQIPSSPFPSGGRDPVAAAVSSDYSNLFVSNQDDNSIVQFVIGSDGKLYPFSTVNTPGIYPVSLTANQSNVFSVALYEPLPQCSTAAPCSGAISVFPLAAGGSSSSAPCTATVCMQSPAANPSNNANYWPLTLAGSSDIIVPTAVNVLNSGAYVYVTAYDSTVTPNVGYIFGYAVTPSSSPNPGSLTPLPGSPYIAGVQPSAVASDPSNSYVYATDYQRASVLGFTVAANGSLTPMTSGTNGTNAFPAGNGPSGVVVNPNSPNYPYVYVANSVDSTITGYSMSNGALTRLGNASSGGTYATGQQPVAIGIDPSTNRFLFTANFLGNTVSGFTLDTTDGSLLVSQYSPFATSAQPVAVAAIPHNGTGSGVQQ
jgi:6-phosphogluconolactonase